jgi:imidazolonepropionase-like amidohydrolase
MKKILLVFCMLLAVGGRAQTRDQFLIKTGKLFDSETGRFKTGLLILVKQSTIEAVKTAGELTAEEKKNYQLIDLSRYTVLPGLIDCHTHLLYREGVSAATMYNSMDAIKPLVLEGDAYRAVYGAARAKAYLEAGITSVQDLGNSGQFADIALQRAIDEQLVPGPHMSCAGQGLSTTGGQLPGLIHKHQSIAADEYRIIKGTDDAVQAVRENITQGANVIKIYSNNTPNNTMLSIAEMEAIVQEAHRYNRRVTAHATSNRAVYNAAVAGVDGIEHGYEIDDTTLVLMAQKGIVLVPTDIDSVSFMQYAKQAEQDRKEAVEEYVSTRAENADRLQRALQHGVTIAFGSDDYIDLNMPFAEPSKRVLIAYAEEGVAIPQILQFATINAARQVNRAGKTGVLKKGYLADIIAVDSDADTNIQAIMHVHFVMKEGKVYVNK